MEIFEKISFLFFQKNADISIVVEIGYPSFSLWIPKALAKIYFLPSGHNLGHKKLYLVGTVLSSLSLLMLK